MQCPSMRRLVVRTTIVWSTRTCYPHSGANNTTSRRNITKANSGPSIAESSEKGRGREPHIPPTLVVGDYGSQAFTHKKTSDLLRALLVFHLCSYPFLVKHSLQLMGAGRALLGRRLFAALMRGTIYGHFVGGETVADVDRAVRHLRARGVGAMLCVPIEEDSDGQSESSAKYENNLEILLDCVGMSRDMDPVHPHSQMKITSVVPAHLCLRIAELYPNPTETPNVFDSVTDIFVGKENTLEGLSPGDNTLLADAVRRLDTIGQAALEREVFLLLDAEYIRMNPAFKILGLAMMLKFNTVRPVISYTYQTYLKFWSRMPIHNNSGCDWRNGAIAYTNSVAPRSLIWNYAVRLSASGAPAMLVKTETFGLLTADEKFLRSRDVCFGVKLVRGAYLTQERHLAAEGGYPDPVNSMFERTSEMYRRSANYMLERVAERPDKYYVMIASHNETTVLEAVGKMKEANIKTANGAVFFGSLYGMCDYLATTLGEAGYGVYKSIPYGTIDDTIPYLTRRAQENGSIMGGTQKERTLLRRAVIHRLTFGLVK